MAASATNELSAMQACVAYLNDNKEHYYINGILLDWLLEREAHKKNQSCTNLSSELLNEWLFPGGHEGTNASLLLQKLPIYPGHDGGIEKISSDLILQLGEENVFLKKHYKLYSNANSLSLEVICFIHPHAQVWARRTLKQKTG